MILLLRRDQICKDTPLGYGTASSQLLHEIYCKRPACQWKASSVGDYFRRELKTKLIEQNSFKTSFQLPFLKFSFEHENDCKLIFPGHGFLVLALHTGHSLKLQ